MLIQTRKGQTITVCDCHAELIQSYNWYVNNRGYATTTINKRIGQKTKTVLLHRVLVGAEKHQFVDHKNHDKLDDRCTNLRIVTKMQNSFNQLTPSNNSSGYKGVTWSKRNKKWQAQIGHNWKHYHLGYFTDIEEAARAYDEAAKSRFGEYALTNV